MRASAHSWDACIPPSVEVIGLFRSVDWQVVPHSGRLAVRSATATVSADPPLLGLSQNPPIHVIRSRQCDFNLRRFAEQLIEFFLRLRPPIVHDRPLKTG